MKHPSFPLLRSGLWAALALASATCWAQLPSETRTGLDPAPARGEAPLAQGGGNVTFKVKSAKLACDGLTPFKSAQKIRLHYTTYHPVDPNVELELVVNPGNTPVTGGRWPLPPGNNAQPFISPAVTLQPGLSVTVKTYQNSVHVASPLHNRVVVVPNCGPRLDQAPYGGIKFDIKVDH